MATEPTLGPEPNKSHESIHPIEVIDPIAPSMKGDNSTARRRHTAVAASLIAVMLVGASALATVAWQSSKAAARADDRTAALVAHRSELRATAQHDRAQRRAVADALATVKRDFTALSTALGAVVDAHNGAVDAHNHGAQIYNSGRASSAVDVYGTEGAAAVATEETKVDAAKHALADVQTSTRQLEEALR